MRAWKQFWTGPWRAVPILGTTQIIAWGAIFYTPVLIVPQIAAERGWSLTFGMAGMSLGLFVAGLTAPKVGALIDQFGGHRVMPFGSIAGAIGLVTITYASHPIGYLANWVVLGFAMGAGLYDPAFATLGRIFGIHARAPITAITLAGGFASTVSWPLTHSLVSSLGWKGTYLVYAAVLVCVAAPLHAFALPRSRASSTLPKVEHQSQAPVMRPSGAVFILMAAGFAAYAFAPSALGAHLLALFERGGIEQGTAVVLGAMFGPAQVGARICEFAFARRVHPLTIARCALALLVAAAGLLLVLGVSVASAAAFMMMFGIGNGLMTIARGTVPLALFGAAGYGRTIGRIAGPGLVVQSAAPVVLALVSERISDRAAIALAGAFLAAALACLLAVRRPAAPR